MASFGLSRRPSRASSVDSIFPVNRAFLSTCLAARRPICRRSVRRRDRHHRVCRPRSSERPSERSLSDRQCAVRAAIAALVIARGCVQNRRWGRQAGDQDRPSQHTRPEQSRHRDQFSGSHRVRLLQYFARLQGRVIRPWVEKVPRQRDCLAPRVFLRAMSSAETSYSSMFHAADLHFCN